MPFFKEEKLVNVLNWIPNIKRIKQRCTRGTNKIKKKR